METLKYDNIIIILSSIVVMLVVYRLFICKEEFKQIDICDYNSPDPNEFCKSIQKGCSDLITDNKNLNTNIKDNCTTLPTDTKDIINTAIGCNDTVNKIIMNNYVQKEVCSQIKNFPEVLPPSITLDESNSNYKSLDNLVESNNKLDTNYAIF
jgi:hypothetical protein